MRKYKINLSFDHFDIRQPLVASTIRSCIEATLNAEKVPLPCEINVLVTTDAGIHAINKETRNMDKPTDVLSFPMFQLTPGKPPRGKRFLDQESGRCPLGDMCISLERASQQAEEFGHSLRREVGYLTIHSMLHLLGYDHLDEGEQKRQMRTREEEIANAIWGMRRD